MSDTKYCRLCLNEVKRFSNYFPVREVLTNIFPGINLRLTNTIKLCEECFNDVNFTNRIREVFLLKTKEYPTSCNFCRFCWTCDTGSTLFLDKNNFPADVLKEMIEVALFKSYKVDNNSIICNACWSCIKKIYSFKMRCFQMEKTLELYRSRKSLSSLQDKDLKMFVEEQYRGYCTRTSDRGENAELLLHWEATGEMHGTDITSSYEDKVDICDNKLEVAETEIEENVINLVDDSDEVPTHNASSTNQEMPNRLPLEFTCQLLQDDHRSQPQMITNIYNINILPSQGNDASKEKPDLLVVDDDCYEIIEEQSGVIDLTNVDCDKTRKTLSVSEQGVIWGCYVCAAKYTNKNSARMHILKHEDLSSKYGRYQCKHCPFKANWKGTLTKHKFFHKKAGRMRFIAMIIKFLCPYCNSWYPTKGEIQSHMNEHIISYKLYQCIDCMFTTNISNKLRLHYRNCHCIKKDPSFVPTSTSEYNVY